MNSERFLTLVVIVFFHSISFGRDYDYRYQRAVDNVTDRWHIIAIPDDLYGKISSDLSDLRIICITGQGDTTEMPYLIQSNVRQVVRKEIRFDQINEAHSGDHYYFAFVNPSESLLDQITLDFADENFNWKVSLEGSNDQQQWFSVLENYRIVSVKNAYTHYDFTTLNFHEINYRYLRLAIPAARQPKLNAVTLNDLQVDEGKYRSYETSKINISNDREKRQTVIDIDVAKQEPVASLVIEVKDTLDYYRPVRIQYLTDSVETEQGMHYNFGTLATGVLSSLEDPLFNFTSTVTNRLKVIIDNQDNQPLEITGVRLSGNINELVVRFSPGGVYYLIYGQKNASKPNYDIEQFKDKIPDDLVALKLGDEKIFCDKDISGEAHPLFENKLWLWAMIIAIVVGLGWFSLKLLRT